MAKTCQWIFNDDVRRGEPLRRCPMAARDGSSLCVFHHRRSRRKMTKTDRRQIEGVGDSVQ